jgi:hypothetical protein
MHNVRGQTAHMLTDVIMARFRPICNRSDDVADDRAHYDDNGAGGGGHDACAMCNIVQPSSA